MSSTFTPDATSTRRRNATGVAVFALCAAVLVSACGSSGDDSESGPIKLGAISSLTGPAQYPDATKAAQAVFDRVNAEGGIDGRKIEYSVADDASNPATSAQVGRKLVDQTGVVAFVGGASNVDCGANAAYYVQRKVVAIPAVGVGTACFSTPNISPVNTGPFAGYTSLLYYASEVLKKDRVCAIVLTFPGLTEGYLAAAKRWETLTGKKLFLLDSSVGLMEDPTPAVLKAKNAGCNAVAFDALPAQAAALMKAAKRQKFAAGSAFVTLTSVYDNNVAKTLGKEGNSEGLYVNSEFLPYSEEAPELDDWRTLMRKHGVPETSFAQGGYVSASIFVDVLKGIKGGITRDSVTKALKSLKPVQNPLIGTPYTFGPAKAHNPNQASQFVQLSGSSWRVVTPDWVKLPQ